MESTATKLFSIQKKYILTDIEGTTSSIGFVKETLFSYARKHIEKYIRENANKDYLKTCLQMLKDQNIDDVSKNVNNVVPIIEGDDFITSVINNLLWQMDIDRKTTSLKKIQGYIWKDGYNDGELHGHVYDDVVPALKTWKKNGKELYVYSSGSVEAQKLLFGHSINGDLLDLFSGYFDTETGPKIDPSSYSNIASKIGCDTTDIIFLTDVVAEAEAAKKAGCEVFVLERPGNAPIRKEIRNEFRIIQSFSQLNSC